MLTEQKTAEHSPPPEELIPTRFVLDLIGDGARLIQFIVEQAAASAAATRVPLPPGLIEGLRRQSLDPPEDLMARLCVPWDEAFTKEEIHAIGTFYRSSAGRKLRQNVVEMERASRLVILTWMREQVDQAVDRLRRGAKEDVPC